MVWHELIQVPFDWELVIVNYIFCRNSKSLYVDLIFYAISIERDDIMKILGSEQYLSVSCILSNRVTMNRV